MKQIASVITISPEGQHLRTGTPLGEHGLERRDNSKVAAWLAEQSPSDMDKAAVSRALQHNVGLQVRFEGRYPSGPNGEKLPSYQVAVNCEVHGDDENRKSALADLRNFLTPAPKRDIEEWLSELSVIVAKRRDGEFDESLRLEAYTSRLAQYPADVARYALLGRTWQFWPTWAEIEKICEAKAGPRLHMINALSRPAPEREPAPIPPTEEEKQRIDELVRQAFPTGAGK